MCQRIRWNKGQHYQTHVVALVYCRAAYNTQCLQNSVVLVFKLLKNMGQGHLGQQWTTMDTVREKAEDEPRDSSPGNG